MAGLNEHGREYGNGDSPLKGLPAWARFIAYVGVPSGIAIFLVWTLASAQGRDVADIKQEQKAHIAESRQHSETTKALERLLRLICMNTSPSQQERGNCLH